MTVINRPSKLSKRAPVIKLRRATIEKTIFLMIFPTKQRQAIQIDIPKKKLGKAIMLKGVE